MENKDNMKEIIYQITMSAAKQMFIKKLISKEEYTEFETKMKEKYNPIIGDFFSNIDLI